MSIDDDSPNIIDIQPVISPKSDETSKGIISKSLLIKLIRILFRYSYQK
jgi:hypothetical protein